MSKNMDSNSSTYQSAADNWKDAYYNFNNTYNKYTGNKGYQNSINQAKQGAAVESAGAQAQATTASRNAGLSKSAAAAKGSQAASGAYLNSFNGQQQQSANQGNNAMQASGNQLNSASNYLNTSQAEGQNIYNREWGNVGTAAAGVGEMLKMASDERLKNYHDCSSKVKCKNVKNLKWEKK